VVGVGYDDGNRDIPTGIATPVERVVVVGAGIAGLTIASALRDAGVACVVLEARDRIGGRLHTIDLAGTPVDLGGSWIHHPIGNPLRAFAEQAGVTCDPGDPLPTIGGYDQSERRRLTQGEVDDVLALQLEGFPDAVDELRGRLRGRLGGDATAWQASEAFLATSGLDATHARRARQALRAVIEADAADLAEHQSLRWLWNEIGYDGDLFGDLPADGYRSVVTAMAAGVDVRLDVEVTSVELTGDGVRVHGADGSTEEGSHVVVAVPLGVLKAGRPAFSPALPNDRMLAIDRLGFGRYEKVALRFEEPFWAERDLSHLMVFRSDESQPALWVFDLHAFGAGPALVGHLFHSATPIVLDRSPDEAVRWFLEIISEVVGGPCPEPVATVVTAWASDPFAAGAYTHVPVGADPAWLDLLGRPVGDRILFAGEHTQSARAGYADGAMSSGIREAKRLLAQPAVQFGPRPQRTV
jgi:monoamine oxidase